MARIDETVNIHFKSTGAASVIREIHQFTSNLRNASGAASMLGSGMANLGSKMSFQAFRQGLNNITQLKNSITQLSRIGVDSLNSLQETADSLVGSLHRLNTFSSGKEWGFQEGIKNIEKHATDARVAIETYSQLASRIQLSGIPDTKEQTLGITDLVSKAMAIGGNTSEEAKMAGLQFAQAIGSGRLQGDEFRSIMENATGLADALAKGMGVSKGDLRDLSKEGEITSGVMIKALIKSSDYIEKTFAKSPVLWSQNVDMLKNKWDTFVTTMRDTGGPLEVINRQLSKFIKFFETDAGQKFLDKIRSGFDKVADVIVRLIKKLQELAVDIANNAKWWQDIKKYAGMASNALKFVGRNIKPIITAFAALKAAQLIRFFYGLAKSVGRTTAALFGLGKASATAGLANFSKNTGFGAGVGAGIGALTMAGAGLKRNSAGQWINSGNGTYVSKKAVAGAGAGVTATRLMGVGLLAPVAGSIAESAALGLGASDKTASSVGSAVTNVGGGAAAGAITGGWLGSLAAPGLGTAVGASIGAITGALGGLILHLNDAANATEELRIEALKLEIQNQELEGATKAEDEALKIMNLSANETAKYLFKSGLAASAFGNTLQSIAKTWHVIIDIQYKSNLKTNKDLTDEFNDAGETAVPEGDTLPGNAEDQIAQNNAEKRKKKDKENAKIYEEAVDVEGTDSKYIASGKYKGKYIYKKKDGSYTIKEGGIGVEADPNEEATKKYLQMWDDLINKIEGAKDTANTDSASSSNPTGGKLDSVDKVGLDNQVTKYLKEISANTYLIKLKQITPKINVKFGDVRESADTGKILASLDKTIQERYATSLV